MRDIFDFFNLFNQAADTPKEESRKLSPEAHMLPDGRIVTTSAWGFCPGCCDCMHCAAARVRVKWANRVAEGLLKRTE